LGENVRYPLVQEALGSDAPVEVSAQLLCRPEAATKLMRVRGADGELPRLLQSGLGFVPPARVSALDSILEHLGTYILFSEFAFDLPGDLPEPLTGVAKAGSEYRDAISSLCERMRTSDDTREGYIALAGRVETALRLAHLLADRHESGSRDTFPFEERTHLRRLQSLATAGNLAEAREVVEQRRRSVWRHIPERALLWKLAERCVDFLVAVEAWNREVLHTGYTVRELVQAYTATKGFWQTDRQQRLVEQGAAACAEDKEVSGLLRTCRERYAEVAGAAQSSFLRAVELEGWPPEGVLRQTQFLIGSSPLH
jgi:hypothetical protein